MNNAGRYVFFIRQGVHTPPFKAGRALVLLLVMGILGSCLGISSEIAIGRDGSGTITLEYRISRMVESLGKLDGNERWLPVPVGQADFERTIARIEGLTMDSFSSKSTDEDIINTVKLAFANREALVRFLDATGQRASWEAGPGGNRLTLSLGGGAGVQNQELLRLAAALTEGYSLRFSLSLPGSAALSLRDSQGRVLENPPAGTIESRGGRVVFSSPMADMLSLTGAVVMEIGW
ncbi:MAG: hypothetical protein LBP93_01525 [Treponema sp.]|jgi:hypothetical protein|nr:hypothetical protein [Treponema sp.]